MQVERATHVLRDLLAAWPERPELAQELVALEHEGDAVTRDVIRRLSLGVEHGPVDLADGLALAKALDDIVDFVEESGDHLGLYGIEAPMVQADELAEVLVEAGQEVGRAVHCLRGGVDPSRHLEAIHRLESDADRLSRGAVASLFVDGVDPLVVIRWKDIYELLESAVDACDAVANVLQGIAFKAGAR